MTEHLFSFPFPISVNESLSYGMFNGQRRTYSSPKHKAYKNECKLWVMSNLKFVDMLRENAQRWRQDGFHVAVSMKVLIPKDEYYTKTKEAKDPVKRFDVTNRIKQCHDALSEILDIDDRYFRPTKEEIFTCDLKTKHLVIHLSQSDAPKHLLQSMNHKDLTGHLLSLGISEKGLASVICKFDFKSINPVRSDAT